MGTADTRQELPASVYAAFAAGGAVEFPAGEWVQTAWLETAKAVQVTCPSGRCWLVPQLSQSVRVISPVRTYRTATTPTPARQPSRLTGVVSSGTTSLTMAETWADGGPFPGEKVRIGLSLQTLADPAEFWTVKTMTVLSLVGTTLTFTEAFGVTPPAYASVQAVRDLYDPGDEFYQDKIGEWGTAQGGNSGDLYCKGYGSDHGLFRFSGDGLIDGASIDGVGWKDYVSTRANAGNAPLLTAYLVDNLSLSGLRVDGNRWGDLMLVWHVNGAAINDVQVTGTAWNTSYGGSVANPSYAVRAWGGSDVALSDVAVGGTNWRLIGTELNPINLSADGVTLNSGTAAGMDSDQPHLNLFGDVGGTGFTATDVTVSPGQYLFTTNGAPTHFVNLTLLDATNSNLDLARHTFAGTTTIEGEAFAGAGSLEATTHTVPTSGTSSVPVRLPEPDGGLIRGGRVRLTTIGGCRALTDGHGTAYYDQAVPYTPGTWVALNPTWTSIGSNWATYKSELALYVWGQVGAGADAVIELEVTRIPPA